MLGRVVKGIGGFYYVDDGQSVIIGNARKNLKRGKNIIYVGDIVEFELRNEDGDCIINKVRGVNRVCYDISSKPPSTIEWE